MTAETRHGRLLSLQGIAKGRSLLKLAPLQGRSQLLGPVCAALGISLWTATNSQVLPYLSIDTCQCAHTALQHVKVMWLVRKPWPFAALLQGSLTPCLYAACLMIAGPLPEPWSSSPGLFSLSASDNDLTGARAAFHVTKRNVVIDGHVYQGREPRSSPAKLSNMQMEV